MWSGGQGHTPGHSIRTGRPPNRRLSYVALHTKPGHKQPPQPQPYQPPQQPPQTHQITDIQQPQSSQHHIQQYPQKYKGKRSRSLHTRILHNLLPSAPRRSGGGLGITRIQMQSQHRPNIHLLKMPSTSKQHTPPRRLQPHC